MWIEIPPKHPVASVIGVSQGEERDCDGPTVRQGAKLTGEHCWARGYAVSTVGFELEQVRQYIAAPIQRSYENLMRELRARNAVGVVVAVNGDDIIWADIFASTLLLEKYWSKLARSYAAETITRRAAANHLDVKSAQAFLQNFEGRRESVESEPGVYKDTEISGDGWFLS